MEDIQAMRDQGFYIGIILVLVLLVFRKYILKTIFEEQRKTWEPLLKKIFGVKKGVGIANFLWGPQSMKIGNYLLPIACILFGIFMVVMFILEKIQSK